MLTHIPKSMGPMGRRLVSLIIITLNSVNKSQYFEIWVSKFRNTEALFSSYGLWTISDNFVNFQHKRVPQQCLVPSLCRLLLQSNGSFLPHYFSNHTYHSRLHHFPFSLLSNPQHKHNRSISFLIQPKHKAQLQRSSVHRRPVCCPITPTHHTNGFIFLFRPLLYFPFLTTFTHSFTHYTFLQLPSSTKNTPYPLLPPDSTL